MYEEIIRANEAVLYSLDKERYPFLYKYLFRSNSSLRQHLVWYWWDMAAHRGFAERDSYGVEYHTLTNKHMANAHGGREQTWGSHSIFLRDTGLLGGRKPDKFSKLGGMELAFKRAVREDREAPIFYYIVPLTEAVLVEAEKVASQYASLKIGISDISKTDVILVRGQRRANAIYKDKRTISETEERIRTEIINAILNQIEERGYTTKEDVRNATKHLRPRGLYDKAWQRFRQLCKIAGVEFGQPNQEDKKRFALSTREWILTKRAEA